MNKYALRLAKDQRISYACRVLPKGNYTNMILVDELPKGRVVDYKYIDNSYVYEPIDNSSQIEVDIPSHIQDKIQKRQEKMSSAKPSQLDVIEAKLTYIAMMTDLTEVL